MQLKTVTKQLHTIFTLVLLVTVIGFIWSTNTGTNRADDKTMVVRQLDEKTWLYVTEHNGGGATVPYVYRYYLAGKPQNNLNQQLADCVPFLRAATANASVTAQSGVISVHYQGRVFAFNNSVPYRYNNETIFPHIHFRADYSPTGQQKQPL